MNTQIKMILFDIDGTLLSKQTQRLSPAIIAAFHHLRELGIRLFLCSGRNETEIKSLGLADDFAFDGYVLLNGGLCIVNNETVYQSVISKDTIHTLFQYMRDKHLPFTLALRSEQYLSSLDERAAEAYRFIHTPIPEIRDPMAYIDVPIFQLNPFVDENTMKEIMEYAPGCKYTSWYPYAYDLIPENSGKAAGILKLSELLDIPVADMMAFGDDENDIGMMDTVAYPIAMDNSNPIVFEHAVYTCGSVDSDGILDGLKHYHLIDE